ncbi:MAG TPA: transcription antitermination factor NusB [Candidatus Cloacimonadota bacterium]|nr:transcription antitermination factor NusB [Candidatus Cloacimonadota bacterium]
MGQRRKAREMAFQTLYALDFCELDPAFKEYSMLNEYPAILMEIAESEHVGNGASVYAFADELVKNTIINFEDIETEIDKHAEHWSCESIARPDRSLLHLAVYELMFTGTPAAVVINESIEIAKKFCSESTGKFLNGILDAIHKSNE